MNGFILKTPANQIIRFNYYAEAAPITIAAFEKSLPFTRTFLHARVSGQEIWTDKGLALDIIQENASVFTEPGEIVLGPLKPHRAKTSNCIGIYYGEGKGVDCCNIFARVVPDDLAALKILGEQIWKNGWLELTFENIAQ